MHEPSGLSRRRFLGRAAVVGATLVWAAPGVQLLSVGRAFAASGSGQPAPGDPGTNQPGTGPTQVLGETFTNDPSSANGGAVVAASNSTAELPMTGSALPVGETVRVAGGMVAAGAVLTYLAHRVPAAAEDDGD